jgi:hypothetical protein
MFLNIAMTLIWVCDQAWNTIEGYELKSRPRHSFEPNEM